MRTARVIAMILALTTLAACRTERKGPNVVLVGIESLRADELKTYGAVKSPASYIDLLATKGVAFTQARASSSWSLPSWASVLTGRFPSVSGVVEIGNHLDRSWATMAEPFASNGYRTAAFVSNPLLAKQMGFSKGFDQYVERPDAAGLDVVALAEKWVDENRDSSFFLALDFAGPQMPYASPDVDETRFRKADLPIRQFGPREALPILNYWPKPEAQTGLALARTLYRAEIDHVDRAILSLIQHLQKRRLENDTIVVIFSLHGEEFMDRGLMNNGMSLDDDLVRVPLVILAPGRVPADRKIDTPVGLIDLFPTLTELAGVDHPTELPGKSLVPLWGDDAGERNAEFRERPLILETSHSGPDRIAVVVNGRKAVFSPRFSVYGRDFVPGLYDLVADPREETNLLDTDPGALAPYESYLTGQPVFSRHQMWRVSFGSSNTPTLYSGRVTTSGRFVSSFKLRSRFLLGKTQLVSDDFLFVRGPQSLYFAATSHDGANGFQFEVDPPGARVEVTPLLDGKSSRAFVNASSSQSIGIPVDLTTLQDVALPDAAELGYTISSEWVWSSSANVEGHEATDKIRPSLELVTRLADLVEKRDRTLRDVFVQYTKGSAEP